MIETFEGMLRNRKKALQELVNVCPETLAGTRVEMLVDGDGEPYCSRCGASLDVVQHSASLVQADWEAGGRGYRKPFSTERSKHQ